MVTNSSRGYNSSKCYTFNIASKHMGQKLIKDIREK